MALGGPPLVKAVTGQEIGEQELGGSKMHTRDSGVGDLEVKDDAECIAGIKRYLSFFPSSCRDKPPVLPVTDLIERRDENLVTLLPENPRQGYDMYDLVTSIVDSGTYLDIKGKWAKSIITCLARIGGYPCGIVASNPRH